MSVRLPSGQERSADPFPWRFLTATALGLPGVVALALLAYVQLAETAGPRLPLAVTVVVQPAILLLAAAAVGAALAPRVGLQSHVLAWTIDGGSLRDRLRAEVGRAVVLGTAVGALLVGIDVGFDLPVVELAGGAGPRAVLGTVPVRSLYGGVTEEILLRFGVLTALVWVGCRLTGREHPSRGLAWAAILTAVLLFGLLHLSALAGSGRATPVVAARVVALNATAGVALGWLYWRDSLEAAMIAHAAFHVVSVLVSLGLVVR